MRNTREVFMQKIFKICKKHGALIYSDVYIRKTRNGIDCKYCSLEYCKKDREKNPEKYKKHGKFYRKIILDPSITHRNCSKCKEYLPLNFFSNAAQSNRHPYCKSCMSKANKISKIRNKETYEKYKVKTRLKAREKSMIEKYGLTLEQYQLIHDEQNGVCKICGNAETALQPNGKEVKDLCVDHCHKYNIVRGLLCHGCNAGIGYFKDNIKSLEQAIIYLKRYK
jgi:hypothetical protein